MGLQSDDSAAAGSGESDCFYARDGSRALELRSLA